MLVKTKSKTRKTMKPRLSFPANEESFAAEPRRRVRRLAPTNPFQHSRRAEAGDANMQEEEKEA